MERHMVLIEKETLDNLRETLDFKNKLLDVTLRMAEQLEEENGRLKEEIMDRDMVIDELMGLEEEYEEDAELEEEMAAMTACDCHFCRFMSEMEEKVERHCEAQTIKVNIEDFLKNF